jgi:predicted ATP-grasp superfamily ATP-dependent carboligase
MTRKVLLVTTVGWMSTARYAGGFAAASWTVDALAPAKAPVKFSRYVERHFAYRPLMALSSLGRAIAASKPDLVVPCDDRAVRCLLRLAGKRAFEPLIRRSLGALENYDAILSRDVSMTIAAEIGVRTPETLPVASEAELETCLARLGLPAVLKLDGSWGGEGVSVVRSRDEALAAFRRLNAPVSRLRSVARALRRRDAHHILAALAPPPRKVSVQKFVTGRPAASAFAAWEGEVKAAVHYDVLVADGAIGPPNVIRRVDCPQIADASARIARHFGLSGLFGLDFIRDEAGCVHLLEINPRPTQGGTLAFGDGRDLPQAMAQAVTRCETGRREALPNDVVAFFPREWQRDMQSPYLLSGHHDVPWDDPAVLKDCFDSLPEARDPMRRSALELLKLSAPAPGWRRPALARS